MIERSGHGASALWLSATVLLKREGVACGACDIWATTAWACYVSCTFRSIPPPASRRRTPPTERRHGTDELVEPVVMVLEIESKAPQPVDQGQELAFKLRGQLSELHRRLRLTPPLIET